MSIKSKIAALALAALAVTGGMASTATKAEARGLGWGIGAGIVGAAVVDKESQLLVAGENGLGKRTRIELLEITWPSGQIDRLTDIPIDRIIAVKEGAGIVPHAFPKITPKAAKPCSAGTRASADSPWGLLLIRSCTHKRPITRVTSGLSSAA